LAWQFCWVAKLTDADSRRRLSEQLDRVVFGQALTPNPTAATADAMKPANTTWAGALTAFATLNIVVGGVGLNSSGAVENSGAGAVGSFV